jgi:HEAT repeat protein
MSPRSDGGATDVDDEVQRIRALGLTRDPKNLVALTAALAHPKDGVRGMAARALGWLREPCAVSALTQALDDPAASVRRWAVMSLALCGDARVQAPLIALLTEEEDPHVRAATARTLGWLKLSAANVQLRDTLRDSAAVVRAAAVEALNRIGDPNALPALIELLKDPEASVRRHAVRAVGSLADARHVGQLSAHAGDPDPEVRAVTIRLLARRCPGEATNVALAGLNDENPGVRATAVIALKTLNNPGSLPALEMRQTDPDPEVRYHVRLAIQALRAQL